MHSIGSGPESTTVVGSCPQRTQSKRKCRGDSSKSIVKDTVLGEEGGYIEQLLNIREHHLKGASISRALAVVINCIKL